MREKRWKMRRRVMEEVEQKDEGVNKTKNEEEERQTTSGDYNRKR